MHRFYTPGINFKNKNINIVDKDEIHHIKDVLRLKDGNEIVVFNGCGEEAFGRIVSIDKEKPNIVITIQSIKKKKSSGIFVSLGCAVPKRQKFEYIIEKSTELGVDEIIPMKTKRTEIHWTKEKVNQRLKRYQTIALNAAKQSGRTTIPVVRKLVDFKELVECSINSYETYIACLKGKRISILNILRNKKKLNKIMIFIGPEGDFTDAEVNFAKKKGCVPLSLGNNVLKVDTAAIIAVGSVNLLIDERKI